MPYAIVLVFLNNVRIGLVGIYTRRKIVRRPLTIARNIIKK